MLAYAFMSNHFHIFIYVPSAEEIGEGEILRRIRVLYRDASLSQVVATWNRLKTEEQELFKRARPTKKYVSRFEAYKSSFVRRMWNSAEFMRTFKQHFTMSFNGRREHSGTMFEGRYHERNHPAERPTMWRTSAYIDINAWEAEKEECRAGRGASPFRSKADPRLDIPDKVGIGLGKGSERTAKRILELLVDGPMRPSALREAVGIKSPIHFSRYYLRPLMEKGIIERTDPDSPKSPRQEYKLA